MAEIWIWIIVFIGTLIVLVISADLFIKVAEKIGLSIGISPFVVGVTLVALGTSLPELVTSIAGVLKGNSEIVLGNIVGSNIANMGLVLGMVGIIGGKIKLKFDLMSVDLPIMMGASVLLYLALQNNHFSLPEGLLFIAGLGIYLTYVFSSGKAEIPEKGEESEQDPNLRLTWQDIAKLIASVVLIYFSANYNVEAIDFIAQWFDVGNEFVAQTAVALGTSLPELVVSVVAIRRQNAELAVGNIVGSNIFNIFCVMGIPRLLGEIEIPRSILEFGLPGLIIISGLALFSLQDKMLTRWEGFMLLFCYLIYIGNLTSMQLGI
ncbi:MAG: calcium/sodium antiporter [Bacteroidota bacterium]